MKAPNRTVAFTIFENRTEPHRRMYHSTEPHRNIFRFLKTEPNRTVGFSNKKKTVKNPVSRDSLNMSRRLALCASNVCLVGKDPTCSVPATLE